MDEIALVLLCERPALGVGKQRLAASIGIERAHQVAQALLACALEDAKNWNNPVVIAPASEEDHDWATTLLPSSMTVWIQPQTIGNLGQRISELDCKLRNNGLKQLVYIGSDTPLLTKNDYTDCRTAFQHHDTVLVPAINGGIALMANCTPWPVLADLPWSTDQLSVALIDCCRRAGQSVAIMEQRSDVDKLEDCLKLITLLQHDVRSARRQLRALVCAIAYTLKIRPTRF
ncbi:DUF2064 domain-containing protein [Nitrosomonas communis]|uniref:DUF2064 domain-containing protein n=1 Tax=Nitrosomonas communis TaxID=44574 RepID=A0A1I4XIW0_9PROT|nr:DUF2064 domain-containing protein [Nitrosomonas communis]SFN25755.1 hypothetical protein SAMN05421863_11602 [Nitrosomonas communis]